MSAISPVLVYVAIALFAIAPLIPALLASGIAAATGTRLNEADAQPCIVLGRDISGMLYGMFMMGWFGMFTFPLGLLGAIGYSLYLLLR